VVDSAGVAGSAGLAWAKTNAFGACASSRGATFAVGAFFLALIFLATFSAVSAFLAAGSPTPASCTI